MNKICGIYKITSPSGKIYIGQSRNINQRKYHYSSKLGAGQPKIHNSILKYGWVNHNFEIICECDELDLNNLELYYIKYHNCFNTEHGLNLNEGGNSVKMLNETKIKISNALKGIKRSEETKHKISISKKNVHTYYPTQETKYMISNALKGIKRSEETIKKMCVCKTGLKHTNDTKEKISKSKSGTYEIYDNNNKLFHKVHGNIKKELKLFNFPEHRFCDSYRNNEKIKGDLYENWYVIKL